MKRYIRTNEGKIIDTSYATNSRLKRACEHKLEKLDIIAESDNILDLIQVGDLIEGKDYKRPFLMYLGAMPNTSEKYGTNKIYTRRNHNWELQAIKTEKGWEVL